MPLTTYCVVRERAAIGGKPKPISSEATLPPDRFLRWTPEKSDAKLRAEAFAFYYQVLAFIQFWAVTGIKGSAAADCAFDHNASRLWSIRMSPII